MAASSQSVGEALVRAYRDLVPAEARLGEALARRGLRVGASVVDQWPVLLDHLHLYARGLSPAGMLVLGGAPDEGSRATGIPFTGGPEARRALGLHAPGARPSPQGDAFWGAVERSRASPDAPMESFFATAHLAHALPFDAPAREAEVMEASARHVLRLLAELRPQVVVCVGAAPLAVLARILPDAWLRDLADVGEKGWAARWPPRTPLHAFPAAQVPGERPFRLRVVPVAALDGAHASQGCRTLAAVLPQAWT